VPAELGPGPSARSSKIHHVTTPTITQQVTAATARTFKDFLLGEIER
jgi:hypothetical protein